MATEAQFNFFKSLYEDEAQTAQEIEGKAKVYLGIISAFLVAILLKTDDVVKSAAALNIPFSLILIEAILMSASLVCVVFALRIRQFEAVNDGVDIIGAYGEEDPTDDDFYQDRIADYAVASSRNRGVNNETSTLLAWASRLLIGGMIYLLMISTFALWRVHGQQPGKDKGSEPQCVVKCDCDQKGKPH
jgi:hypothetical protein